MVIDTHAHLDLVLDRDRFLAYNNNNDLLLPSLSEILLKELEFVIHISLDSKEFEINYPHFKDYAKIYYATGIYPDRLTDDLYNEEEYLEHLKNILIKYPHVALGEIGIDLKYESYGLLEDQERLFRKQLTLAEELALPVIIHSRESFNECFNILREFPKVRAVFHCFSYGQKELNLLMECDYYVSFAGILSYKKSTELQSVAETVRLDRIFFETDAPYLSPEPFRGKWNTPDKVQHTYLYFSHLRGIEYETLCKQVKKNVLEFFAF